jgi:elongation factor P
VGTYSTNEFKKGLKIQIDGVPFQMIEMTFRTPGKGAALDECKLKNLLRGTVTDRTYRAGQSLEEADVVEFTAQYLYQQSESFVFMDNSDYEQYELTAAQVGDGAGLLKEGLDCQLIVFNNNPIGVTLPNHVMLQVEYCEPAAKGNTATNVSKAVKLETGGEIQAPAFINIGDWLRVDTRTQEYVERTKGPDG